MIGFLATVWCLALALELWPDAPFSRCLNARSATAPLAWFAARRRANFAQFIVAAVLFVAARDLMAMPGSVELSFLFAANAGPVLGAVAATALDAAVSCWKAVYRAHRVDLSYWQVRALDVSNQTFGKCARRARGDAPAADNDDDAPALVIAA